NVPFLWHGPIQNGSASGHLAQHHRYSLLQIAEALAKSVSGDAATDGVEIPHHVVKGGPFLFEIERLDHFKEISGSIQNGLQGEKSNVKSDSGSLASLTSQMRSDALGRVGGQSFRRPKGPAGDLLPRQVCSSGQARSFAEIELTGSGHSIPSFGSSNRRPPHRRGGSSLTFDKKPPGHPSTSEIRARLSQ